MTKPSAISEWMFHPETFSAKEQKETASLLKSYPYLLPLKYLEAAANHRKHPYDFGMMTSMQLYMGNLLLFHEFLTGFQETDSMVLPDETEEETSALASAEDISVPAIEENEFMHFDEDAEEEGFEDLSVGFEDEEEEIALAAPLQIKEESFQGYTPEPEVPEVIEEPVVEQEEPIVEAEEEPEEITPEPSRQPVYQSATPPPLTRTKKEESLIPPIYTEDYFLHQGINVSEKIPAEVDGHLKEKSLMVVMSFSDWMTHFKTKGEKQKEEEEDQKALRTMWQKEKLAQAMEEENEEIPENVFEMAVNSITKEDDLASESLAEILLRQGKHDKAIDMLKKLSLRNPEKSVYFARKIDQIHKEKDL